MTNTEEINRIYIAYYGAKSNGKASISLEEAIIMQNKFLIIVHINDGSQNIRIGIIDNPNYQD